MKSYLHVKLFKRFTYEISSFLFLLLSPCTGRFCSTLFQYHIHSSSVTKHRFLKKFIPKQFRYPSLGHVTLNSGQAIPSLKLEGGKEITWLNEIPIIYNEKNKDKIKWDLSALLS